MGFKKPDLKAAKWNMHEALLEIHSPFNDGYTQSSCKKDLYVLKCWLEDEYSRLPKFVGEEQWEQERLIEILKN